VHQLPEHARARWSAGDVREAWSDAWQQLGGRGRGPDDGKNGRLARELAAELNDDPDLGEIAHEDLAEAFRLYLVEHNARRLHWRGPPSLYTLSGSGGLSAWLTRAARSAGAAVDDDPDLAEALLDDDEGVPPEVQAELSAAQAALAAGEPYRLPFDVVVWLGAHPDHPGNAVLHALYAAEPQPMSAK
jgi:hypothetical protein